MRRLLEEALRSGDVLDLEHAILRVQDKIVSSPHPRHESPDPNRLLLQCRKALISHLDASKGILRPLRHATRRHDEAALIDALRRVRDAPAELRRFVRRDAAEAEELLARLQSAAREARRLLECGDRAALARFLDAHAELLPDALVTALLRRRDALLARRPAAAKGADTSTGTGSSASTGTGTGIYTGTGTGTGIYTGTSTGIYRGTGTGIYTGTGTGIYTGTGTGIYTGTSTGIYRGTGTGIYTGTSTGIYRGTGEGTAVREAEAAARGTVAADEHKRRVEILHAAMDAFARMLMAGARLSVEIATPVNSSVTVEASIGMSPVGRSRPALFNRATPDVSPIRAVSGDSLVEFTADFSGTEMSRHMLVRTRIIEREEHVLRKDIEGTEDFDRSVFLLPMAARSSLLKSAVSPQRVFSLDESSIRVGEGGKSSIAFEVLH